MLSNDQLSQLSQLKQDIRSSRDLAQGSVRATSGRFGFVTLDDGREAFLDPDQMDRVFPGDRVEVEVTKNKKDQLEAKLEKLISSSITFLSGRYRVRGKGHFIATDDANFSRWIFIPPKQRAKCQEGCYATAKITQHPFKDGRAQAAITVNIGDENTPYIERLYSLGKFQLHETFQKEINHAANALCQQSITDNTSEKEPSTVSGTTTETETATHTTAAKQDLRQRPFITIDSAATRDMDDALAIEKTDVGWQLSVAIAAPGMDIAPNSPLDKAAKKRGQTAYFADKPLTMLPENLSLERYSLQCQQDRASLVFQCDISQEGEVSNPQFIPALIQSHAKFSYTQVAALLEGRDYTAPESLSDATPFKAQLEELQACTQQLHTYRKTHFIVNQNHNDVALYLDENGKLERIEKIERNCAHSIVEEAMLLTNRCAGDFLAQHNAGIFVNHRGYRNERRADIEALLSEKTNTQIENTEKLESYINTIQLLQSNTELQPLLAVQQRFLEASHLSLESQPHLGLGFTHYATITSPIRRYQDLYNQRAILHILADKKVSPFSEKELEKLKAAVQNNRDATQFMERWLICDYMKAKLGQTFTGVISLLTNQGVGVRLNDTAIEGFVPAAKPNKKDKSEEKNETLISSLRGLR